MFMCRHDARERLSSLCIYRTYTFCLTLGHCHIVGRIHSCEFCTCYNVMSLCVRTLSERTCFHLIVCKTFVYRAYFSSRM